MVHQFLEQNFPFSKPINQIQSVINDKYQDCMFGMDIRFPNSEGLNRHHPLLCVGTCRLVKILTSVRLTGDNGSYVTPFVGLLSRCSQLTGPENHSLKKGFCRLPK